MFHVRESENVPGAWGHAPRKILKSEISEILFPALWGGNLQNFDGFKTPYKILIRWVGLIRETEYGVNIK